MKLLKHVITFVALLALVLASSAAMAQDKGERLKKVMDSKVLRVGTPGDYRPFSIENTDGTFEGHDIDLAKLLAADLGVELQLVKTSWPNLMQDLQDDKFDIAVGGITRTVARMQTADFLPAYAPFNKVALIRIEDRDKFTSLAAIDDPKTTIIVNPGGTNEKFVKENITKAKVEVHEKNHEIPQLISSKKGDVMITEVYEALVYSKLDPNLTMAAVPEPLTRPAFMGFMIKGDDPDFTRMMNFLWNAADLRGDLNKFNEKWLR